MKKLLLLFAMVAGSVAAWADSTVTPTLTVDGTTANLSVSLNNDQNFIAFQMDITMSDAGKTYTNGAGTLSTRLQSASTATVDGNPANFIIATNWVSQNVLRIIGYNLGNVAINGTAGEEIFNMDITASAAFANVEDWTATLSNVIFVTEEHLAEVAVNVTKVAVGESASSWLPGDVDHSGVVDLDDVLKVIDVALSKTPADPYFESEADVDASHVVDLDDVLWIIDEALNKH